MRTESLASSQSCRSIDALSLTHKRVRMSVTLFVARDILMSHILTHVGSLADEYGTFSMEAFVTQTC